MKTVFKSTPRRFLWFFVNQITTVLPLCGTLF